MNVKENTWNDFKQYCITRLQYSARSTVPERIRKLHYMERNGFNLLDFTKQDGYDFFYIKLSEGTATTGVNHYVKALNSWCKFRKKRFLFKKYKEQKHDIKVPSVEDIYSMISVCDKRNPISRRGRMIIVFLSKTGLRNMELCNLKLSNIDWLNNEIHVINGKGGKNRIVPVEKKLLDSPNYPCLKNYINNWRFGSSSEFLFTTKKGRLNSDYLRKRIKIIAKNAGVGWIHPHSFRHFYATNLRRSGIPLEVVKELLGHEDIRSTMIYEHIFLNDIRNAIQNNKIIDIMTKNKPAMPKKLLADPFGDFKNGPGRI